MAKVKMKPSKEQRKAIRDARKIIQELHARDGNEAETRRRVERIFDSVMGYDVLKHLSRERAVQTAGESEHVDFSIQLEPGEDAQPIVMVELKRVGVKLAKKHLNQVTSYAINAGCNWILLTNGVEWKLYHVEFEQPPKIEMLFSWNLLDDKIDKIFQGFLLVSYKTVKKGKLDAEWERVKALAPDSLLASIITENTFNVIRRNLRKDTGILVDREELYRGIGKLLNEASAKAMASIRIPRPPKKRKRRPSKD